MFYKLYIPSMIVSFAILASSCSTSANEQTKHCAQTVSQKMISGYKRYEESWTSMGGLSELKDMFDELKEIQCEEGTDQEMLNLKYELSITGSRWIANTSSVEFNIIKGFAAGYFGGVVGALSNTFKTSSETDRANTLKELHLVTVNKFLYYMKKQRIVD